MVISPAMVGTKVDSWNTFNVSVSVAGSARASTGAPGCPPSTEVSSTRSGSCVLSASARGGGGSEVLTGWPALGSLTARRTGDACAGGATGEGVGGATGEGVGGATGEGAGGVAGEDVGGATGEGASGATGEGVGA